MVSRLRKVVLGCIALVVVVLALVGARTVFRKLAHELRRSGPASRYIPISANPGPGREPGMVFELDDSNAARMRGIDDPVNERWCDMAGNFYADAFVKSFSYASAGDDGPVVRVRIDDRRETLRGRLEARGLKPNFAYQVKLRGIFSDREAFERIGHVGRWRLPGKATNWSDADYRAYARKDDIESYVLFDFFATDARGDAVRSFALESSLHVLWNAGRQRKDARVVDLVPAIVDAGDADVYTRPKPDETVELLWAEREKGRYTHARERIRLPAGDYTAELVLTEESFHSQDRDGGWWATVCALPISFTIVAPEGDDPTSRSSEPERPRP